LLNSTLATCSRSGGSLASPNAPPPRHTRRWLLRAVELPGH
jgi:hypothetical protein